MATVMAAVAPKVMTTALVSWKEAMVPTMYDKLRGCRRLTDLQQLRTTATTMKMKMELRYAPRLVCTASLTTLEKVNTHTTLKVKSSWTVRMQNTCTGMKMKYRHTQGVVQTFLTNARLTVWSSKEDEAVSGVVSDEASGQMSRKDSYPVL
ncbi:hypothetical protein EYF80_034991 [Liparis tanakae]|uniref:Uncharacterized protein n=1 Tax=Liparis tanakae TaxID=230148 RepID=A0A4Z2GNR1_9TELE|nr:hypothetical protein EYF80_034991 [Liparis tanakae]